VDLSSLSFQLLDPGLEVGDFILKLFDAVGVGTHSFVKGARQEIGHGFRLYGSRDGCWLCRTKAIGHVLRTGSRHGRCIEVVDGLGLLLGKHGAVVE